MPGPLQVIAVSFGPGADFQGRVLAEVDRLQGRGVLRLLDVLFVDKNEDGTLERVVVGGDDELGALLSSFVLAEGSSVAQPAGAAVAGFDPAEAFELAMSLPAGTGLAFLLIEHSWAQPLFEAIDETGGVLLSDGFLNSQAGSAVATEVAALEEAAQVIAAAHTAEARAMLRAMVAETEAAEAVAASDAIRSAAAASAIGALIAAGIVEEEATHEAIDAVSAAGLIIAAADEAASDAIAADAARVAAAEEAVAVADEAAAEAVAEDAAIVAQAGEATAAAVAEDAAAVRAAHEAAAAAVAEDVAVVKAADEAAAGARATLSAASLTVAEARVLRYLSTRLTFALIADKLGISRSAAKDRADRVYKKLGVHNRADAVRRARELGLIK
jgi:DNA-binding CsgD family transcriptional regulator